jgi:hypothetical protein
MDKKPLLPLCRRCGGLAEYIGNGIYCEHCNDSYWEELYNTVISKAEFAAIAFRLRQEDRLGVYLDRKPEEA